MSSVEQSPSHTVDAAFSSINRTLTAAEITQIHYDNANEIYVERIKADLKAAVSGLPDELRGELMLDTRKKGDATQEIVFIPEDLSIRWRTKFSGRLSLQDMDLPYSEDTPMAYVQYGARIVQGLTDRMNSVNPTQD